ncbi:MAG: hypothetical protein E6I45_06975, partial [Chloroflexi bacterium]
IRVVGIGDFAERGFSQLGLPGLMRRTIGSNIGNEPRLGALVEANEIESYSFPQGVLSQLMREIAGGRPGLVTHVGLGTYVDPRQTGGKQNAMTTEDLVEVVTLRGQAHRSGRIQPGVHGAQVVGHPRAEAHLRQHLALDVDPGGDLGEHETAVLEGEDRPLRDVAHLLST